MIWKKSIEKNWIVVLNCMRRHTIQIQIRTYVLAATKRAPRNILWVGWRPISSLSKYEYENDLAQRSGSEICDSSQRVCSCGTSNSFKALLTVPGAPPAYSRPMQCLFRVIPKFIFSPQNCWLKIFMLSHFGTFATMTNVSFIFRQIVRRNCGWI